MGYISGLPKSISEKITVKDLIEAVKFESALKLGSLNLEFTAIERLLIKYKMLLDEYGLIMKYNFVTNEEKAYIKEEIRKIKDKIRQLKIMLLI